MTNGSEVDPDNVIAPAIEELDEEAQRKYEKHKMEFDRAFASRYQKTRQGVIRKGGEFTPVYTKPEVTPTVSNASLTEEQVALMIDQQVGASVSNTLDRLLSNRLKAMGLEVQSEKDLKQPVLPHANAYNISNDSSVQHGSLLINTSAAGIPSQVIPQGVPVQHIHSRTNALSSVGHSASSHAIPNIAIPESAAPMPSSYTNANMANSGAPNIGNYTNMGENSANLQTPLYRTVAYSIPLVPPQGSSIPYGPLPASNFNSAAEPYYICL